MSETQVATETQENESFSEPLQSAEEKFLGVTSTVGKNEDSNIEVEVINDTPVEDRRPPKKESEDINEGSIDKEIGDLSENANKRIKKLKYEYHEERREKEKALRLRDEAVNYAKNAVSENQRLSRLVGTGQQELVKQAQQRAQLAKAKATDNYKTAYEAGDAEKIAEAQTALTDATFAHSQAVNLPNQIATQVYNQELKESRNIQQNQQNQQQPVNQPVNQPDEKAQEWAKNNGWFGSDDEMTSFAYGLHNKLVMKEGIDPKSDQYYDRIDKRMREIFPNEFDDFVQEKAVEPEETRKSPKATSSVVAPATRNNGAKPTKVKLTATQVSLSRKLGITPEQYAAQLVKDRQL